MILTNRLFKRIPPSREAKNIYIFCEGAKKEYQYFRYFQNKDSRINVKIYKLDSRENNSPIGLLNIAKKCIILSENNPNPKYSFLNNDEVWIVFDTDKDKSDSRKPQIEKVRNFCKNKKDWFVTESNPCFEVWLYYHLFKNKPNFEGIEQATKWKQYVPKKIKGGFDSNRHPIYIEDAIINAENNFELLSERPNIGSTEVYNLAKNIFALVKLKIKNVMSKLN